jgi:hypothetical protein
VNTDLETWLQDKFAKMGEALGRATPLFGFRIAPPLAEWEANYFLLGLEENLFQVNERGEVESLFLRGEDEDDSRPYRIFSSEPPRLLRENICQLAAAARLIIERGWLPRHVGLEPGQAQHHSYPDHFDLLVRSPDGGKIFIWVEVRRTTVELEKLIADLRACSRRGPHAHEDCGFPQNHPRHEFCVANQPAYIWAVAPDGEIAFAVNCMGTILELAPLSSLPPRSLFELGKA